MFNLLVIALVFALLFEPALATTSIIDSAPPLSSMESFYQDPDGLLVGICDLCGNLLDLCGHAVIHPPQRVPTFTAETFLSHPEWPRDALPLLEASPDPEPVLEQVAYPPAITFQRLPLFDELVEQLDANATTVLPSTVQIHVEGTYTPGDRLVSAERRRATHKRQAPRPGGFPCLQDGCGKTFDRSCDLKRHQKTHLNRAERPHKCTVCNEGFLYPKDRIRHERTHDQSSSNQVTLYCHVPGCSNVDGFSRRDNLLRHQRKQHPHLITA